MSHLRYFYGSCVVVCGGALSVLFSTREKSLSVKLQSTSTTTPATDATCFFFFAQTLTLCLEASGWREFAHGRFLRSSHCRSYLSLFLSLWLHLLLCLSCSVSLIPLQLLSVETIKPISFSDTLTGCPGWTKTQEPGFPKTVTWFKAANKLAANYLSNTCWWRR